MNRHLTALAAAAITVAGAICPVSAEKRQVKVRIIETSDVHGNYFPYDFINGRAGTGSLARVHTAVENARKEVGKDNVILVDNGDILQGQPTAYNYNFIDTTSRHVAAEMMDFMGYDLATLGNHDIETGHEVYDRWIKTSGRPVLGANIIDTRTGKPYVDPYKIVERDGLKIAFLGMITPGIPGWLPENLWEGLKFEEMVPSASKWVSYIRTYEKPDVIIGLFHSGRDHTKTTGDVIENASVLVAREVPGFDVVMMGHDHSKYLDFVKNHDGKNVLVGNPANNADLLFTVDIEADIDETGKVGDIVIKGDVSTTNNLQPSAGFMERFEPQRKAVEEFVGRDIGELTAPMSTRDAYFGPSAFVDFIHSLQLAISGAQISMAAPLTFDATIPEGKISVSDMFNLYKYENMLYTMRLTGSEIKNYLEMSYDMWTRQMTSADDHLLNLRDTDAADMSHTGFRHPSYNFDSAAGIIYTVDVTKPKGEKITIISMADGTPFAPENEYTVAINSYRGNGGGNLLTEGAGIAKEDLKKRIVKSTDKDLRYYMMKYIEQHKTLTPAVLNHWKFIPEEIVAPAAGRDRQLLFND